MVVVMGTMTVMGVMVEKVAEVPVVLGTLMTAGLCFVLTMWIRILALFFFFNQLRLGASYLSPLYLGFLTVNCPGNLPPQQ